MTALEPQPGTGQCLLCSADVPSSELVSHLSVMHPDQYEPFLTWPDGSIAVDMSEVLEPHEFNGGTP